MRERPILFSGPMVRAILEGRKTQTRRAVKIPGLRYIGPSQNVYDVRDPYNYGVADEYGDYYALGDRRSIPCPYGQPGDRLWVRETWAPAHYSESVEYHEPAYFEWRPEEYGPLAKDAPGLTLHYRADGENKLPAEFSMPGGSEIRWRPSIHMPRWASRITLTVAEVRVERVQDISEEDARVEGVEPEPVGRVYPGTGAASRSSYRAGFARLWDDVNGKRPGCSWDESPWVWVIRWEKAEVAR